MSEPVEMTPAGIPVRIEIGDGGENVPVSFTIAVPVETGDAGEHSPDEYVSTLPVAVPRIRRRLPCDDDAVMYESDDETAMGADDEEDVEHDLNVIRELLRTTLIRRNDDVE